MSAMRLPLALVGVVTMTGRLATIAAMIADCRSGAEMAPTAGRVASAFKARAMAAPWASQAPAQGRLAAVEGCFWPPVA